MKGNRIYQPEHTPSLQWIKMAEESQKNILRKYGKDIKKQAGFNSLAVIWGTTLLSTIVVSGYIGFSIFSVPTHATRQDAIPGDCQYESRPTTPSGGCDNTDPCDPTNIKNGGACTITPAKPTVVTTLSTPEPIQGSSPVVQGSNTQIQAAVSLK